MNGFTCTITLLIYAVSTYVPRTGKEDEVASTVAASVGEEKKRVL
jgi:hypothetical protein